jgi:hypothetical protein
MREMYQFARTMAASMTPDPAYLPEVERETMVRLRELQREYARQGYEEGMAGLLAMKEFQDAHPLEHVYPARDPLAIHLRVWRDRVEANPRLWGVVSGAVFAVILALAFTLVAAYVLAA